MGWFKKTFGFSSQDTMDKFTPESVKNTGIGPNWMNPLDVKPNTAASLVADQAKDKDPGASGLLGGIGRQRSKTRFGGIESSFANMARKQLLGE